MLHQVRPLVLQGHGSPLRFCNIRIQPLSK